MPKRCSVGVCRNTAYNSTCHFFKFPRFDRDPERRRLRAWRCGQKLYNGQIWEPEARLALFSSNRESRRIYTCAIFVILQAFKFKFAYSQVGNIMKGSKYVTSLTQLWNVECYLFSALLLHLRFNVLMT
jgi:hypothetical protein